MARFEPLLLPVIAVVFDSDGVLVDSGASVDRSWTRWAAERGLDAAEVIGFAHGHRSQDTVDHYAPSADRAAAQAAIERYELDDAATVGAIPGAVALAGSMPRERWAVYTSASTSLGRRRLAAARIPDPPILVTGEQVARGKPDPEGYRLAITRLGVDPRQVAVLEDSAAGVRAALAAGAGVVVGVGGSGIATEAPIVVRDLDAIRWADGLAIAGEGRLR